MVTKQKILIVDDDNNIAELISLYLTKECFETRIVNDGEQALKDFASFQPDLILLDLMLPGIDGYQVCREIRHTSDVPIIMLSAKSEDYDKITGLNVGADDYITKPFNPLELIARVRSQLRRYVDLGSMEKKNGVYKTGGLTVDDEEKTVTVDGEMVAVTPTEFGILKLLVQNAGRVYSMDQIYEAVWKEPAYNPENTVAVHIRRIREKIEINPKDPRYLKVVWGIGYKIEKI